MLGKKMYSSNKVGTFDLPKKCTVVTRFGIVHCYKINQVGYSKCTILTTRFVQLAAETTVTTDGRTTLSVKVACPLNCVNCL